jgi:Ras-related protein Rab-21
MADRGGATRKFKVVLLGEGKQRFFPWLFVPQSPRNMFEAGSVLGVNRSVLTNADLLVSDHIGRVGKTSILLRYIKGEYDDRQVSTLQASYLDKRLMVDNRKVQLSLWDTAGQERFHALGPIYYRDADGALLVYDITDDESFRKVRTWVKELRRIVGDDIDISIAGNKSDLQRSRKVSEEDAKKYAESVGATHFLTSAKLNRGLEDVFVELTKRMLSRTTATKKKIGLIADDDGPIAPPPPSRGAAAADRERGGRATTGSMGRAGPGPSSASAHGGGRSSESHAQQRGGLPARDVTSLSQSQPPRTNPRQVVIEDNVDDPFSSPSRMTDGLRVRGASNSQAQHEATKAKSGCC